MLLSTRYQELHRCLAELRKALLPVKFEPTGMYRSPARVHLRVISFRLLVHAEVECFFEDRAFELFDAGWKAWAGDRAPNRVVLALLAYSGVTTSGPPEKLGGDPHRQKTYDDITVPLKKAQAAWRATHKANHGIKEANVLALLLPLGVAAGDLDTTLLADLTSFGGSRGAAAHSSPVGVTTYADPKSEYDRATQLISALRSVDESIARSLTELTSISKAMKG